LTVTVWGFAFPHSLLVFLEGQLIIFNRPYVFAVAYWASLNDIIRTVQRFATITFPDYRLCFHLVFYKGVDISTL